MALTKNDLINKVYKSQSALSKKEASIAVEGIIRIIKSNLEKGSNVLLTNFGKFSIKEKSSRIGRNPHTGESMILDARKVVTIKPSGKLLNVVNDK
jgi:integration host factor subunit alpha